MRLQEPVGVSRPAVPRMRKLWLRSLDGLALETRRDSGRGTCGLELGRVEYDEDLPRTHRLVPNYRAYAVVGEVASRLFSQCRPCFTGRAEPPPCPQTALAPAGADGRCR